MVIFLRKINESIVVGGESALGRVVKVTVLEIGAECVKLAFEANEDVGLECANLGVDRLHCLVNPPQRLRAEVEEYRRRWLERSRGRSNDGMAPCVEVIKRWSVTAVAADGEGTTRSKPGFGRKDVRKYHRH